MDLNRSMNRRSVMRMMAGGFAALGVVPLLTACGGDDGPTATPAATAGAAPDPTATTAAAAEPTAAVGGRVTIYSGRSEELLGPAIAAFQERTGIEARVRYAGTSELAAQILEEGANSPADIYFSQDAGALGALANEGMLAPLPEDLLGLVDPRFRSPDGFWVGVTGRARVIVYNTDAVEESELPASILDFTAPEWSGRLGWAPTNASFQTFVTALRVLEGEDVAHDWLTAMRDNDTVEYSGNTPIVEAVIAGEIDAGLTNHYYLHRMQAEAGGALPAANFIYRNADPGSLINIAGAAILVSSAGNAAAESFIEYILSNEGQTYFAQETYEYPLVTGVAVDPSLVPLEDIQVPDLDLSDLADLEGTLELMRDVGLL